MRSYRQYCSLARALDVVGDRWNLLIVRELSLRGPCRYSDLLEGLPGIATNLLAERLRTLETAGVIAREQAPPPVASTLFTLTERGEALHPVLRELGRWGIPLMLEPEGADEFRSRWLEFPAQHFLTDTAPERAPIAIELRTGDEPVTVHAAGGKIDTKIGPAPAPDLVLEGTPRVVLGLLTGQLELEDARALGLRWEGDAETLERVRPRPGALA
jgi:DNA-binding HxlR family transcriptional regulator